MSDWVENTQPDAGEITRQMDPVMAKARLWREHIEVTVYSLDVGPPEWEAVIRQALAEQGDNVIVDIEGQEPVELDDP